MSFIATYNTWLKRIAGVALVMALALSGSAQSGEIVRYVLTDHLGSPVIKMDMSGRILQREVYGPYGQAQISPNNSGIGYTGHMQDGDTGLTYMQARYYDPEIARFLSVDPIGFSEEKFEHFNLYWYGNGNPLIGVDFNGEELTKIIAVGGDSKHKIQQRTYLIDSTIAKAATSFINTAHERFPSVTVNNIFRTKDSSAINTTNLKAPTGRSRHQAGFAIDFNGISSLSKDELKEFVQIARDSGFGQALYPSKDPPHFSADPTEHGYDSLDDAVQENKDDYKENFKADVPELYE